MFSGPPHAPSWWTKQTPWLDWWIHFLEAEWKRGVNRDMWNMTYEFYAKTIAESDGRGGTGETLAWWDEDGAWPGVIDDFVAYVVERRKREGIVVT